MRKAMVLGVLGLAGTFASPAFADEFTGFRLAMNLGEDKLDSTLFFNAAPPPSTDDVKSDQFAYGFSGGWALNRYFAVEVGLHGGSQFNEHVFSELLATPDAYIKSRTNLKAVDVTAVGTWWIGKKFGIFGRAGMKAWKAEETMIVGNATSVASASASDNGFDPLYGGGIQTVLDGALVRLEYLESTFGDIGLQNAFNLRDNKVHSLMFSIVWTL